MSILFLFAGIAPAFVGWISDRYGHLSLIMVFSLLSGVCIVGIPYLGSGAILVVGLGALGALLWALRPVVVSAAMSSAPPELSGSIVAFIYGANMSVSFAAPILAGPYCRCLWLTDRSYCDRILSLQRGVADLRACASRRISKNRRQITHSHDSYSHQ
jgi:MFS family permease